MEHRLIRPTSYMHFMKDYDILHVVDVALLEQVWGALLGVRAHVIRTTPYDINLLEQVQCLCLETLCVLWGLRRLHMMRRFVGVGLRYRLALPTVKWISSHEWIFLCKPTLPIVFGRAGITRVERITEIWKQEKRKSQRSRITCLQKTVTKWMTNIFFLLKLYNPMKMKWQPL